MINVRIMFVVFLSISFTALESSTLYQKIEAINLHAFKQTLPPPKTYASYTEQLQATLDEQQNLSDYQKRLLTFSIFKTYEKNHPINEQGVVDETTWRDLNLFAGSASHPTSYLGALIDRSATELGSVRLLSMLANPETEIAKITAQQNAVKELVNNDTLFTQLDAALQQLKQNENLLLSWFNEHDAFQSNAIFFKWIKSPGFPAVADFLNTNSPLLEVRERLYEANMLYILALQAAGTVLFPIAGLISILKPDMAATIKTWAQQKLKLYPQLNSFYIYGFVLYLANLAFKNQLLTATNDIVAGQHNWLSAWTTYDQLEANNLLLQGLQRKLMSLARCVEIMDLVTTLTENNPILFNRLKNSTTPKTDKFNDLVAALKSNTFAGNESSIFSYAGHILSTAKRAYDNRDACVNMLAAIGEIDALMSIARLYKESNNHENRWNFAQYKDSNVDQKPSMQPRWYNTTAFNMNTCFTNSTIEPFMHLDAFWNPLINHKNAIPNTVNLGLNQPRTIIITGINKGGKSTNMKGVIINALCAQTIGIVPANDYLATPFTKIVTYCSPHDDITKGISHFEAGEQRALNIYKTVGLLQRDQHALCMLDEAFDGTHHAVSVAATSTLIKNLGYNPHVICLTTTHLPEITKLADEHNGNHFANYYVESRLEPNGRIIFTHQLKPGISYQNKLALELLRQQNYPSEFIQAAYDELQ